MKNNQGSVFFTKDITLEEEYNLIFTNREKSVESKKMQPIFGNKLLPTAHNLQPTRFVLEDQNSYTNNDTELILLCLLNNKIFFNFVNDLNEKINRKTVYVPFINNLINYIDNYYKNDFLDISDDLMCIYRVICKKIHDDLIRTHFFEEESWTSKIKKKYKFEKKIFNEYSPIVEIFHGKYEKNDNGILYKIHKDHINLDAKDDAISISEAFFNYMNMESVKVEKYPLILVLKLNAANRIDLQDTLVIERVRYRLSGYIVQTETHNAAFLNNDDKWFMCKYGSISSIDKNLLTRCSVSVAFYQIQRIPN